MVDEWPENTNIFHAFFPTIDSGTEEGSSYFVKVGI